MLFYTFYASPVGKLLLLADHLGLRGIEFEAEQNAHYATELCPVRETSGAVWAIFCKTREILDRYFLGEKIDFSQLDFLTPKGTPFQQAVWQELRTIPYGTTLSYGEIATKLGKPNAMRAVGGAVGRNPISILIPCHRVLGKNQTLTGFGGGLPVKRYLLRLENIRYKDRGREFVAPKNKVWE